MITTEETQFWLSPPFFPPARGHELVFRQHDEPDLQLQEWDEYLYDGLILFAPAVDGEGEGGRGS